MPTQIQKFRPVPLSISDDDLCAACAHCRYNPGDMSTCDLADDDGWPADFDADGYAQACAKFVRWGLAARA